MQRWRPMMGNAMLEVNYEGLVSDLDGQARSMVDFLDLDWSETCLHPEQARRAVRTASFRQVRRGVHTDSIDRWLVFEKPLRKLEPLIRESRDWVNGQTAA